MKTKTINLPVPPKNWSELTMEQWRIVDRLRSERFASREAMLAKAFIMLTGLKPVCYAERWREVLGAIPLVGSFVLMTGRELLGTSGDLLRWTQWYRRPGLRGFFGERFPIADEAVLSFKDSVAFLTTDRYLQKNPVARITLDGVTYDSHQAMLKQMTWGAYSEATFLVGQWRERKNRAALYQFIAHIYGISDPTLHTIQEIERSLDPLEIELILLFWDSVNRRFSQLFPHIFKPGKPAKDSKKAKGNDAKKDEADTVVFIARKANLSPGQVRREMLAFDALTLMEQNAVEVEEQKKELNKIKSKR